MKQTTLILLISLFAVTSIPSSAIAKEKAIPILHSSASSSYVTPHFAPEKAIDGYDASFWGGKCNASPWWITFDTGAMNRIGNIQIKWYSLTCSPADYDIQISPDNHNWEDVFTGIEGIDSPDGEIRKIDREARYIRLYINASRSSFVAIREFTTYKTTVPHLLRFQGALGDSEGLPLEGTFGLTFSFYDQETGGTSLWQEAQENIVIEAGLLDVELGSITSFDYLSFDKQYWLEVQVEGDTAMTPRFKLTGAPYAFMSEE
ncbi:MAG: discoidin domain-containing protein [Candidatus Omnitrophica bacterium]|nr:discoidin domain-containing protein [Candidatus Omnitrophota bacterium]